MIVIGFSGVGIGLNSNPPVSCDVESHIVYTANNTPEGVFVNFTLKDDNNMDVASDGIVTIESIEGVPVNRSYPVKMSDFNIEKREEMQPIPGCGCESFPDTRSNLDVASQAKYCAMVESKYCMQRVENDKIWYSIKDEIPLPYSQNYRYIHQSNMNMTNDVEIMFETPEAQLGGMQMLSIAQVPR